MATIGYARVSTDQQTDSGLGMAAQLTAIEKAAGGPVMVYTDEGYSGSNPNRPGLLGALEALGEGDTLVVAKRDRLARDMMLACWIAKEVKRKGARVVSAAGEGTESDGPAAVLMGQMIDAFAQYERSIIGARTKAALRAKRAKGEKTGGCVPFGWRVLEDGRTLVEDEDEQRVVALVIQLKSQGWSLRKIGAELESRGTRTKRGGEKWNPETVKNVLILAAKKAA